MSTLWLEWAGFATDSFHSNPPNVNQNIYVYAFASNSGYYSSVHAGCEWRQFDVLVAYTDIFGIYWYNVLVGKVWFGHNTSWQIPVGNHIWPNGVAPNPYGGSGTVYFVNNVHIGNVYNGAAPCSSGSHTHMEFLSHHNWGAYYEYHSALGEDYYQVPSNHVHNGGGYTHAPASDGVSAYQWLGFIGGMGTSYWMIDNPYFLDH